MSVYGKYGLCYRIGGDEFCSAMHKNLDKLDFLNNKFNGLVNEMHNKYGKKFGVSVGYACYDEKTKDIKNIIKQADEMMYEKK